MREERAWKERCSPRERWRKRGRLFSALLLFISLGGFLFGFFRDRRLDREAKAWRAVFEIRNEEAERLPSGAVPREDSSGIDGMKSTNSLPEVRAQPLPGDPNLLRTFDFRAMQRRNPDIVGWIMIPGTRIDYPVCQHADDNYYLKHGPDGEPDACGAVFLSGNASLDDGNLLVFGHNMRSGRMFGQLRYYREESFWAEHPYVYFYTPQKACRARIFSSYTTDASGTAYETGCENTSGFAMWLQRIAEASEVSAGFAPEPEHRCITLSTCTGRTARERRVVHASVTEEWYCRE